MIGIAVLLFLVLLAVATLHLAWSLGSLFPADDEKTLARTVAGFRGIEKMPPRWASLAVAVILLLCGLWAFAMTGTINYFPYWMVIWGGIKMVLIFGGRGVLGYTAWWRRLTPEQPFASLDRRYYSPFCLAVAAGFLILTLERLG
jgi:hypothetical protein